jgi:PAS domain S-box-containing protein
MNVLNYIFSTFDLEEIISGRFAVVNSENVDYDQFVRDRLEYLYIDDLNAVIGAKEVLGIIWRLESLSDYAENTAVVNIESLDLRVQKPYLLVRQNGAAFGVLDMENYRQDKKLFGREITGVIREILNSSHDAICIVDDQKRVLHWNEKAEEIYGIRAIDITGHVVSDVFPKALLPHVIDGLRSYDDVFNNPREEFKNIIKAKPLMNGNQLLGGVSCDKDITEMVQDAKKLNVERSSGTVDPMYKNTFKDLVGDDVRFMEIVEFARKISDSNINVLITGESGTGKELFAQSIHNESKRKGKFVPVNCSAIPKDLIESELFGYEKGTFTGALSEGKIGKFELANNGTILLDEIGDLPLGMQPKILRILEDGIFYRVGGSTAVKVDVRIVASTNSDLKKMMEKGVFRKDLFYRLNSVHIDLPPLRERQRDIPLLINKFVEEFTTGYKMNLFEMPSKMIADLSNLKWEGNIRELRNIIERYVIMTKNGIKEPDLPVLTAFESATTEENLQTDLARQIENFEKRWIVRVLDSVDGNQSRAAKMLGVPRTTLIYKMKKHHIHVK